MTTIDDDTRLKELLGCSVLPMQITEDGSDDKPLEEVIVCDSISGGAKYFDGMPERLSLIRRLKDGTEFRMEYIMRPDVDVVVETS